MEMKNIDGRFEVKTDGKEFQLWVEHEGMSLHIVMSAHSPMVTCWRNRRKFPAKMKVKNLSYKV